MLPTAAAARAVTPPTREEILEAETRLRPHLAATPVVECPRLDALLKLETLQPTGSFKVRGALSALTRVPPGERVVTASAGNHALGVAFAAAALGVEATVVLPETASAAKVDALARFPVTVVRHGSAYDEAELHALGLAARGGRYVSPYNDRDVIAGQGTLALELLRQVEGPLTVVCPIGGGGLCAGVALWASGCPDVRVIGVESASSPAMRAALDAGRVVEIAVAPTVADGLGGNLEPGTVTFELVRRHVDDVVAVLEEEIEEAMRFLVREQGLVVEGAGAVAAAALLSGRVAVEGPTVALVTGRNVHEDLLGRVLTRR
jgi:threonine dehydratase